MHATRPEDTARHLSHCASSPSCAHSQPVRFHCFHRFQASIEIEAVRWGNRRVDAATRYVTSVHVGRPDGAAFPSLVASYTLSPDPASPTTLQVETAQTAQTR